MLEMGLYQAPAEILRDGEADAAVVNFMVQHDGFEEDDWLVPCNRKT